MKKGLDRVLDAWARARRPGEELVVVTEHDVARRGRARRATVRGEAFRALVRRARVYVVAPRREDYGIAQLEALADGCMLVTTDAPRARTRRASSRRELDPRLVGDDLAGALRTALDDPRAGLRGARGGAARAVRARGRRPHGRRRELLPRLLGDQSRT